MPRIALYSHDTFGLGHFRRCLKLGWALGDKMPDLGGLFLTGSPWADRFELPPGFETCRLMPVVKAGRGIYRSRNSGRPLSEVLASRRRTIWTALDTFRPDLLVVDNVPCGLEGEIAPVLESGFATRRVLAIRDVLDDPGRIREEWRRAGAAHALSELYDEVWVFGEPDEVEHILVEGLLGAVRDKLSICGRIGTGGLLPARRFTHRDRPHVLVTCGGGGDAAALVLTYLRALRLGKWKVRSRIVLGPDFPAELLPAIPVDLVEIVRLDPYLERAIAEADVVVSMAGYNTVCEILETGARAVLVPRVTPRLEQLMRAERLASRGRVSMIHPRDLTPESLVEAVESTLAEPPPSAEMLVGGWMAAERARRLITSTIAQAV